MDYNKKVSELTVEELINIIEESVATVLAEMIETTVEEYEDDEFLKDTDDDKKIYS